MLQSWWGECSHWYTHAWMMTCFFSNRAEHVRKQSRLRVEVSRTSVAHHDCVVMEAFKGRTFNFEISKLISNTWTRITSKLSFHICEHVSHRQNIWSFLAAHPWATRDAYNARAIWAQPLPLTLKALKSCMHRDTKGAATWRQRKYVFCFY